MRVAGGTLTDATARSPYTTGVAGSTTVDANAHLQYDDTSVSSASCRGEGTVASISGLMLGGGDFSGVIEGGPLVVDEAGISTAPAA